MEAGSLESPMVEHHQNTHPGEELAVTMELVSRQPRALDRKTLEGVLISEHKGTLMNRRGEWGENLPPKFGILEEGNGGRKRIPERENRADVPKTKRTRKDQPHVETPSSAPTHSCDMGISGQTDRDQSKNRSVQ